MRYVKARKTVHTITYTKIEVDVNGKAATKTDTMIGDGICDMNRAAKLLAKAKIIGVPVKVDNKTEVYGIPAVEFFRCAKKIEK